MVFFLNKLVIINTIHFPEGIAFLNKLVGRITDFCESNNKFYIEN